ncbi:hypothetical protein ACTQ3O_08745 [Mediterraneibacter faecis]|uniref:hypothetical protein n=1 Tax=Mediterraneibacter faecis TaxID=592978 RepID=UPI003F9C1CDD
MKKRAILLAFIISAVAITSGCSANEPKTDEVKQEQTKTESVSSGVTIKPLTQKAIDENPYMAKNDANIHHDCYNSDSTDEVLPVGIYPEINISYEKVNPNASPAVFFDNYGHSVVPLLGGLAIRDINAEET